MKHARFSTIILSTAILLSFVYIREAQATSLSIGANAFYAWWNPAFEDIFTAKKSMFRPALARANAHFILPPSILVGPSIALSLPAGFSLNSVFLWNSWYHARSDVLVQYNPSGSGFAKDMWTTSINKWDLDVTLNYSLNHLFKIYLGLKSQGYYFDFTCDEITTSLSFSHFYGSINNRGIGPGLGVSLNVNILGPIYLIMNASLLYMYSNYQMDLVGATSVEWVYNIYGFNGTLSLAWYIEPASVTLSIGFRYQYLYNVMWCDRTTSFYYTYLGSIKIWDNHDLFSRGDHFYGITFSAVYTFNFGGNE